MAIFERRFDSQLTKIDDTHEISCVIETAQEVDGHTEYLLCLQRGIIQKQIWRILRRYNDFAELHKCLSISGIELPMPGKRFFGNMRPDFIAERRQALQVYINTVLMNPILASSLPAKRFVDPDSYSQSFHDHAVQNALLCLRNESCWTLGSTLASIGWRLRKLYFKALSKPPDSKSSNKLLVKSSSQSHCQSKYHTTLSGASHNEQNSSAHLRQNEGDELVMEWVEFGPDKFIDDKEITGILRSLMNLQHPYIETIVYAGNNENGCLIIRKFHKQGTLKDILCMATPKNPFLSKYGNPVGRTALGLKQVAVYGKQILEALIFLHSKGYPYGHLHSGNIVIKDGCVKLLDIENIILGVPSFYRPFFVQHSKIYKPEAIDVYCFGHVLFEMAMGYPLQESVVRQITTDCPNSLKHLLESILSKESCKAGLPTLNQIINHDFFKEHHTTADVPEAISYFKISSSTKEWIRNAVQKAEMRLREEQKSVKNQKRIVRVQELMSSEEEKRKSRQKKHEHKHNKLKQQSSLQNSNGKASLAATTASVNSMHLGSLSQDESITTKAPPTQPSACQKSNDNQNSQTCDQAKKKSFVSVERQSSSPDIPSYAQCDTEFERTALLESICKFNRGSLRKIRSND